MNDEFDYRYPRPVYGQIPGAHTGASLGTGDRFAGFADLFDYPDPRRLDLRASIKSSLSEAVISTGQRWLVRRYQQRSAMTLWYLPDLSNSMAIANVNREHLAQLGQMIAYSAIRLGDRFAMAGFDAQCRQDVMIMPSRQKSVSHLAAEQIRSASRAVQPGVDGLAHAAAMITSAHAIVFLASDFCCDLAIIEQALQKLARFTVVPIVWQHDDVDHLPSHAGWLDMRDAETGEKRHIWMRTAIKQQWQATIAQHFSQLEACFMRYQIRPLYVQGQVSGEQLTRYFMGMKKA